MAAATDPKIEATPEEMEKMLAQRIWQAHGMTPEEYFAARRAGTLKRTSLDAGIGVFAGEYSKAAKVEGTKRARGKRKVYTFSQPRRVLRRFRSRFARRPRQSAQ